MKLSFQEETLSSLSTSLIDQEKRSRSLEERVVAVESALRALASRTPQSGEVQGAHPETDPVPRSG